MVIEIDGDTHVGKEDKDEYRQIKIESLGIQFLRFSDLEVKRNMSGVILELLNKIEEIEKELGTTP